MLPQRTKRYEQAHGLFGAVSGDLAGPSWEGKAWRPEHVLQVLNRLVAMGSGHDALITSYMVAEANTYVTRNLDPEKVFSHKVQDVRALSKALVAAIYAICDMMPGNTPAAAVKVGVLSGAAYSTKLDGGKSTEAEEQEGGEGMEGDGPAYAKAELMSSSEAQAAATAAKQVEQPVSVEEKLRVLFEVRGVWAGHSSVVQW